MPVSYVPQFLDVENSPVSLRRDGMRYLLRLKLMRQPALTMARSSGVMSAT